MEISACSSCPTSMAPLPAVSRSLFGLVRVPGGVDLARESPPLMGIMVLQLFLRSGVILTGGGAELVRFCLCRWWSCALLGSGCSARCGGRDGVDEASAMPFRTACSFPVALPLELLRAVLPVAALSSTACGDRGVAPADMASATLWFRRSWRTATAAFQRGGFLLRSEQAIQQPASSSSTASEASGEFLAMGCAAAEALGKNPRLFVVICPFCRGFSVIVGAAVPSLDVSCCVCLF